MSVITKFFAGLAGIIHVLFFAMESLMWSNPAVHGIFKVASLADAQTIDVFIKNQGFYNLFLALGMFAGIALASSHQVVGRTLVTYVSLVMIGAAIVLLLTMPSMLRGVAIQGLPPLIALLTLQFGRARTQH